MAKGQQKSNREAKKPKKAAPPKAQVGGYLSQNNAPKSAKPQKK